jgi:glycerate dehydrogenase
MNIVVLDGFTLNPGDLSWKELESLGKCEIHDRTPPEKVVARACAAEIVLTNKTILTREQIGQLRRVKYIGVFATGYDIVDVAAARERGIPVTNVPAYGTQSVAQMTFALLLELTQHVGHHAQSVRDGRWARCLDFSYWDYPLIELEGLTFGIVGFGRIGQAVAALAMAFGMKALANSRSVPEPGPTGVRFVNLETLFHAFLLNTSRGGLVEERALADALNAGRIAGAALDVLAVEPPPADDPLPRAKNCLVTPHIAWANRAARARLMQTAMANIRAFLAGKPQNVVN